MGLIAQAEKIFATENVEAAKQKVLDLLPSFSSYQRQFERQTRDQHGPTVVEAKLSHDLAYYRYFDQIAALAEKAPNLRTLIEDLKKLPRDATPEVTERHLGDLDIQYSAATK